MMFTWCLYRSGWLFAAVYKELWTGEGRRWPAAKDHPSGAGGSGRIPDRTPGADPGSCGPAVRSGESPHTPLYPWSFICWLTPHQLVDTESPTAPCWWRYRDHFEKNNITLWNVYNHWHSKWLSLLNYLILLVLFHTIHNKKNA